MSGSSATLPVLTVTACLARSSTVEPSGGSTVTARSPVNRAWPRTRSMPGRGDPVGLRGVVPVVHDRGAPRERGRGVHAAGHGLRRTADRPRGAQGAPGAQQGLRRHARPVRALAADQLGLDQRDLQAALRRVVGDVLAGRRRLRSRSGRIHALSWLTRLRRRVAARQRPTNSAVERSAKARRPIAASSVDASRTSSDCSRASAAAAPSRTASRAFASVACTASGACAAIACASARPALVLLAVRDDLLHEADADAPRPRRRCRRSASSASRRPSRRARRSGSSRRRTAGCRAAPRSGRSGSSRPRPRCPTRARARRRGSGRCPAPRARPASRPGARPCPRGGCRPPARGRARPGRCGPATSSRSRPAEK